MSLFSKVAEAHGLDLTYALYLKARASEYHEFDNGFVMLVPDANNKFRLISASMDDHYSTSMWRVIRTLLKRRTGPTYMQFTKNYDILYKASKRYGAIVLFDGIVLFP